MAATNMPEILDPAFIRPGRFDRKVRIELPDRKARKEVPPQTRSKYKNISQDNFVNILFFFCDFTDFGSLLAR